MPQSAVNKLVADAASLPPSDFDALVLRLQALRSVTKSEKSSAKSAQELRSQLLYHALSSHLLTQLHIKPVPENIFFNKVSNNGLGKQVKTNLLVAIDQLNTLSPTMTSIEWASVLDLVAGLAVDKVKTGKFDMPWQGISWALKNLPILLDEHFPGYASSNLLKLVLQLRVQKRTPNVWNQPVAESRK